MSLILKAAGYEVPFLVDAMVCSCTMHDGSWNANKRQMCIGYRIFNDNIIVLRNTRWRFSKQWIMKIRGSRRKTKTHLLNCWEEIHLYIFETGYYLYRHACHQLVERSCVRGRSQVRAAGTARIFSTGIHSKVRINGEWVQIDTRQ